MAKTNGKKAEFTLRMPKEIHTKFHIWCLKNDTNMTKKIRDLIENEMKKK